MSNKFKERTCVSVEMAQENVCPIRVDNNLCVILAKNYMS